MFNKIKNEILIYQRTRNYINIVETTPVCKVYIYFEKEPWKFQDNNRILKSMGRFTADQTAKKKK